MRTIESAEISDALAGQASRTPQEDGIPDIAWIAPPQARRVREGFHRVTEDADGFALAFYDTLFATAPSLRRLFKGDMAEQRTKLLRMLTLLVVHLEQPAVLRDALAKLGERHYAYGVLDRDYSPVGRALLETLAARLGGDFSAEDRQAWAELFVRIAAMMQGRGRP